MKMIRETSVSATLYDYELNEHSAQQGGTINNDERTETRQGNLPTEQTSHVTWLRITRTNSTLSHYETTRGNARATVC